MIPACPTTGRHSWILSAANHCWFAGLTRSETEQAIESRLNRDPTPANEIKSAVAKVWEERGERVTGSIVRPVKTVAPKKKWPERGPRQFSCDIGVADLWERSPVRFDDDTPHTAEILPLLFPGDLLVCIGDRANLVTVLRLSALLPYHPEQKSFIVPNPMTAVTGTNQQGRTSDRCLDNTGPRRFAVVECDEGSQDEQAALLWHLRDIAPLVLVVLSGGKSVHGWFFVEGEDETNVRKFYTYAVTQGADSATHTRCQLVRMPDGTRDNGNRQSVVYFDPEAIR